MKTKFRIYDKEECEYLQEPDYRWMLSRNGKLYNSESDKWYEVRERYVVEFMVGVSDKNDLPIFEGDKVFFGYNYIGTKVVSYINGELNISKHVFSKCKIIGTIHDEKYKTL